MLSETEAPAAIASPWAVLGDLAVAVDNTQRLLSFRLPGLEPGETLPLPGPITWGPAIVGDCVLLATGESLLCVDGQLRLIWQHPLEGGPLAGPPAITPQGLLCASTQGRVWLAAMNTGAASWTSELGVPFAGGPVLWGDRVVVPGTDGTLYVVKPK